MPKISSIACLLVLLAACGAAAPSPEGPKDLDMQAADFGCILDWPKVRHFRLTNRLGFLDEALRVANAPEGGKYPVGTIIQLVPDEAMVKRADGWNPATHDWEFFALTSFDDGHTEIRSRGAEKTVNAFGGNCFACHAKAAPAFDLVCEDSHGCDPLPIGGSVIEQVQNSDVRCR